MSSKIISTISILLFFLVIQLGAQDRFSKKSNFPILKGPYLGQKPPGDIPEIFAPGIVSTGIYTRDMAITPDGKEMYFCVSTGNYSINTILFTKILNGVWTEPEVASFANNPFYWNLEPCISPDGKKFFFVSNRKSIQKGESESKTDIWVMDRTDNGWSEPYEIGSPINSNSSVFFPSVARNGTLYFTKEVEGEPDAIYRSKMIDGKYQEPEKLPKQVNCGKDQYNAFISPDESYIIVSVNGRKDSKGSTDYYIVFRNSDDTWNEPINMGDKINTISRFEYSPYVSPDGKYFFFMSARFEKSIFKKDEKLTFKRLREVNDSPYNGNSAIYWIDAKIIHQLNKKD